MDEAKDDAALDGNAAARKPRAVPAGNDGEARRAGQSHHFSNCRRGLRQDDAGGPVFQCRGSVEAIGNEVLGRGEDILRPGDFTEAGDRGASEAVGASFVKEVMIPLR
jgi:hypothetical protein